MRCPGTFLPQLFPEMPGKRGVVSVCICTPGARSCNELSSGEMILGEFAFTVDYGWLLDALRLL